MAVNQEPELLDTTFSPSKGEILKKINLFDNLYLRYFIRKHDLSDSAVLLLGVLIDLTREMKYTLKTLYSALSHASGLKRLDLFRNLQALQRERILEYEHDGDFVQVTFYPIEEKIDEIELSFKNARRIEKLEKEMQAVQSKSYIYEDELFAKMYPIIGELIAKKISEALRNLIHYLNARLDALTSAKVWRYRIKSWHSGIPYGELLLRDLLPFLVKEFFLIQKGSGLLLAYSSRAETGADERKIDQDLVAGMLTAINDFVKSSFIKEEKSASSSSYARDKQDKKNDPKKLPQVEDHLQEMVYGDSKILIRTEDEYFLAVHLYGHGNEEFFQSLDAFIRDLSRKYSKSIRSYSGKVKDLAGLQKDLDLFLANFVSQDLAVIQEEKKPSLWKIKLAAGLLLLFALSWSGWQILQGIEDAREEKKLLSLLEQKVDPFRHNLSLKIDGGDIVINGPASSDRVIKDIEDFFRSYARGRTLKNHMLVVNMEPMEQLRKKVQKFDQDLEALQLLQVKSELEKITIQFPLNVTSLDEAQSLQLRRVYEILNKFPRIKVDIVAFADKSGSFEINKELAEKRIATVYHKLVSLGINAERINKFPYDPEILKSDERLSKFQDQRGIMIFVRFNEK